MGLDKMKSYLLAMERVTGEADDGSSEGPVLGRTLGGNKGSNSKKESTSH
jgi:hypothetical protein